MVPNPGIYTERFQIADRLSWARPDLVAPSYAPKRTGQLSWGMRSQAFQEQYQEGLRSISHVTVAGTNVEAAASDCDLMSKDAFGNDSSMDWDRSRELRNTVLAQLGRGQPVSLHVSTANLQVQPKYSLQTIFIVILFSCLPPIVFLFKFSNFLLRLEIPDCRILWRIDSWHYTTSALPIRQLSQE